jgi:hypothetical protein
MLVQKTWRSGLPKSPCYYEWEFLFVKKADDNRPRLQRWLDSFTDRQLAERCNMASNAETAKQARSRATRDRLRSHMPLVEVSQCRLRSVAV